MTSGLPTTRVPLPGSDVVFPPHSPCGPDAHAPKPTSLPARQAMSMTQLSQHRATFIDTLKNMPFLARKCYPQLP